MAGRLVALDQPGGPEFVDALRRIWDAGDAAFPVDQRLPAAARATIGSAMGVGDDVDVGDALVVATSGSTGAPKGVVLTHDAIAASAEATSRRLDVTSRRSLAGVPAALPRRRPLRGHPGAAHRHPPDRPARFRCRRGEPGRGGSERPSSRSSRPLCDGSTRRSSARSCSGGAARPPIDLRTPSRRTA